MCSPGLLLSSPFSSLFSVMDFVHGWLKLIIINSRRKHPARKPPASTHGRSCTASTPPWADSPLSRTILSHRHISQDRQEYYSPPTASSCLPSLATFQTYLRSQFGIKARRTVSPKPLQFS